MGWICPASFSYCGPVYPNQRRADVVVQYHRPQVCYFWKCILATGPAYLCIRDVDRDGLCRPVHGRLWTYLVRMDLSADHFYGARIPPDRILDRRRLAAAEADAASG